MPDSRSPEYDIGSPMVELEQLFPKPETFLFHLRKEIGRKIISGVLSRTEQSLPAGWEAEWNCLGLPAEAKERFQKTFDKTKGRYSALAAVHCPGDPERAMTFVLVFKEVMNRGGVTIVDVQQQPTNLAQEVNLHPLADYVVDHLEFFAEKFMIPIPPGIGYYLPDPRKAVGELQGNPQLRKDIKARLTCQWRFNNNLKEIGAEAEIRGLGIPAEMPPDFKERYLAQIPKDHQKVRRIESLTVAHFPDDSDRQRIFAKVLNRTLAAADCAIVEQNQHTDLWDKVNLHSLAFWVAKNLDVLVEQVGLSPQEVLRFKLLNEKTVYERRVRVVDYQKQRVYKFSPEKVGEFLEGKSKGVLITVQNGLSDDADQNERWFRKALPFAKGVLPEDTKEIFGELIKERELLRRATKQLYREIQEAKDQDPVLPYLVMPPPAHMLEEGREHLDTVLGRLSEYADIQACWASNTSYDQVSWQRFRRHVGSRLSTGTVKDLLSEDYRPCEAWLIRQMAEVLELWYMRKEMNELMRTALALQEQWRFYGADLRDLYANRQKLTHVWQRVAPKKRFVERHDPENWTDLIKTLTIARAEDRTALRLYDREGKPGPVVDLGQNLDRGRIIIDDFYFDFSIKRFQSTEVGYLDENMNLTPKGAIMLASRVQAVLQGREPSGMDPLRHASGEFKAGKSPIGTFGVLTKGSPFDQEHRPYFFNAEQVFANVHTIKDGGGDKILWGKNYEIYAHFGTDGAKAEKRFREVYEEGRVFREGLPAGETEKVALPLLKDMEVIYDDQGFPDRIIVMDQLLPEEIWLEQAARKALNLFYDQNYRLRVKPFIDKTLSRIYKDCSSEVMRRAKKNLERASRIKPHDVLMEALAKVVKDGKSVGICVLTEDPEARLAVATLPLMMTMVSRNSSSHTGEHGYVAEQRKFKQTGKLEMDEIKALLEQVNSYLIYGVLGYATWDIHAGRGGDSGTWEIARHISPDIYIGKRRLDELFAGGTALLSPEIADSGAAGASQISSLKDLDRAFMEGFFFITSSSKLHPLPELALVGCGDLIRRTIRFKADKEKETMKAKIQQGVDLAMKNRPEAEREEVEERIKQRVLEGEVPKVIQARWNYLNDYILSKVFLDAMIVFALYSHPPEIEQNPIRRQTLTHLIKLWQKLQVDKH